MCTCGGGEDGAWWELRDGPLIIISVEDMKETKQLISLRHFWLSRRRNGSESNCVVLVGLVTINGK